MLEELHDGCGDLAQAVPSSASKLFFSKLGTFGGGTAKRELTMDLLGEGSPGPGSYLPASTFGVYSL